MLDYENNLDRPLWPRRAGTLPLQIRTRALYRLRGGERLQNFHRGEAIRAAKEKTVKSYSLTRREKRRILSGLYLAEEWEVSCADSWGFATPEGKEDLRSAEKFKRLRIKLRHKWGMEAQKQIN